MTAHGFAFGGTAVARAPDGRVVFVPLLLPGEQALVEVVEHKARYDRAEIRELLSHAVGRRSAPCPVYERCGGCNMQHADIATQRELKALVTTDLDRRVGAFSYQEVPDSQRPPVFGGAEFGYRNRVRLQSAGRGAYGFRARSSHEIVPISSCPIAAPEINELLCELSKGSAESGADHNSAELSLYGAQGRVFQAGNAAVEVLGSRFQFPVDGFFQSNLEMTEMLIREEILNLEGERALDLYAGCGLFTRFLAQNFRRVTAVESDPASVAAQSLNLADLSDVTTVAARVEDWCQHDGPTQQHEVAVLDPPRSGLSVPVQQYLIKMGMRRLVYVSCDPATSARDLGVLVRGGYRLLSRRIFDFYPQSSHIETVSVLQWQQ